MGSSRMRRLEMPAQQRMIPCPVPTDLVLVRVGVPCCGLKPATLPLPRVDRESKAPACGRIDPLPIDRISESIERAQRPEQNRVLIFLTPQRRKHGAFLAEVMTPLLYGAEQSGVRADFQEDVMPIFQ